MSGGLIAIAEHGLANGSLPQSNTEAGLPEPGAMAGAYVSYIDIGKHLWFDASIEGDTVNWNCHSNELKQKSCPSSCTCGG